MSDAPKKTEAEKPAAEAAKAVTEAAKTAANETVETAAVAVKTPAKTAAVAKKPAARKTAAKATAAKKPAATRAAPKRAAKAATAAPKRAAKAAPKVAEKTATAAKKVAEAAATEPARMAASAIEISNEIGADFTRFVHARIEDHVSYVNAFQAVRTPADFLQVQQNYVENTAETYSEQFAQLHERYQDLMATSFDPMLGGFKDAGEQMRKMMGV